jgi:hypothetical protein
MPHSLFPIPIPHSPFPVPHSLFPIPYSLFPIPYSPFPILIISFICLPHYQVTNGKRENRNRQTN